MTIKTILTTISLILIVVCTFCESGTPVRRCSGNRPFPLYVQINDCESVPCEVIGGTVAQMDMQFVAVKDETYDLKAVIHVTAFGITFPFALNPEIADVCGNLLYGAYCPLYAEEDVTYRVGLPLDNNYPEINIRTEVRIVDSNKTVISCFIADLKVRRSRLIN